MFDLVVKTILPQQVEQFIRSFQRDGILCILEKQSSGSSGGKFIPCCVISSKWAFWYQGLILDSIGGGCLDLVLRHSDRRIVSLGKSLAQTKRRYTLMRESTRNYGKGGVHAPVLFSQRHGETPAQPIKKEPFGGSASISGKGTTVGDLSIARNLPDDVYKSVLYDEVSVSLDPNPKSEYDIPEDEERVAIMKMHHSACEPVPPTKGQEEVYRYIHKLRTGQVGPHISPHVAMSTNELCEEYKTRREEMDKAFAERKDNLRKAKERAKMSGNSQSSSEYTIVVSKWIAWIHLRLQEVSFGKEIERAIKSTPEIEEYLSLHPVETSGKKKSSGKGKKKKRKKSSVSEGKGKKGKKKSPRKKKRAFAKDTAT